MKSYMSSSRGSGSRSSEGDKTVGVLSAICLCIYGCWYGRSYMRALTIPFYLLCVEVGAYC